MSSNKIFFAGVATIFVVILGISFYQLEYAKKMIDPKTMQLVSIQRNADISFGSTTINTEIVDTEAARAQGLSGRSGLASSTGLFFVFDTDNTWGIWMKDMKFAIDVVWLDKNGVVVSVVSNMKPESYPNVFLPEKNARFVLEMEAGMIKKSKIKIGDRATTSGNFFQ